MKIRGKRKCTDCDTRWSYYETGSVGCPACGSLHSVGIDEGATHTDVATSFDLTPVRADVDDVSTAELAEHARECCRAYVRQRGFVNGGTLLDLDDTYLAANELRHVADAVARTYRLDEADELYFLSLLRDADDGARRPADAVPENLRSARGLADATAVDAYRRDVRRWAEDRQLTAEGASCLELLGDHVKRFLALDGDVEPRSTTLLVDATRSLGAGLRDSDDLALERARNQISGIL